MRTSRRLARWLALTAGIGWGLLWLNSAAASAWLATGPPNPNPEGRLFSAVTALTFSALYIVLGVAVFVALRPSGTPRKLTLTLFLTVAVLAVLPSIREFVAKDRCLDAGGQWSHSELRCLHE
jgi:hypothetical protein